MSTNRILHVIDGRALGGGELFAYERKSRDKYSEDIVVYHDYLKADEYSQARPVFHNHILMWKSVCNCIIKKKEFDIFIHSDFFFAYARLSILRQLLLFPAYLFTAIACRRCKYLFASSISRLPKSIREKAKFTPPVQGYCGCIEKRPVFVWVGRLNISTAWGDIKGIKKLIKIAKKHPEFKFIVYGSGNCSGLFKNLHNIELKGFVVNLFQELDPKTHILLATSKSEGFGRAVHEASCRGLTSYVTTGFPVEVTRLPKVIVYRDIEEELFFLNYLIEHGAEH